MMMNKKLQIAAITILSGAFSASSYAATDTGTASGTVIAPLAITVSAANMALGQFTAGTGGSVVLTTAGALSGTGDVDVIGTTGTPITFSVADSNALNYTVAVSAGATLADTATGLVTMALATDVTLANPYNGASGNINVGGTLTVANGQTAGAYQTNTAGGTDITITANYD